MASTAKAAEAGAQAATPVESGVVKVPLAPVKKVARMCKSHMGNILTFLEHRHANGPMEGLNNAIQGLIKKRTPAAGNKLTPLTRAWRR